MAAPRKDLFFFAAGLLLCAVAPPLMLIGIWTDWRWSATGLLAAICGVGCVWMSMRLDEIYEKERTGR